MSRVAAVFATMNRASTAATCLRRLAGQTVPLWRVVVVDNDSTDHTVARLRDLDALPFGFDLLEPGENLGNAGGVQRAMDRAFAEGADAVWILDDDSWPEPDALERLLDSQGPEKGLRTSLVIDPSTGRPSWPYQRRVGNDWALETGIPTNHPWIRVRRSWLGALVPREIYEKVGPVNGDLFLRGEDEDYPRRIEAAGYCFVMATSSILHHPPGGVLRRARFLGREVALEAGLPPDKLYYRLRNSWWMKRRDGGSLSAGILMLAHLALILRDGSLRRDWPAILAAARDAWGGRLGKR